MVSIPSYFNLMPKNDARQGILIYFIQDIELESGITALTSVFHFCLRLSFIDKQAQMNFHTHSTILMA